MQLFIKQHKLISGVGIIFILWATWTLVIHFRDSSWCESRVKFKGDTSAGYYVYKDEVGADRFPSKEEAISGCVNNRSQWRDYYGY